MRKPYDFYEQLKGDLAFNKFEVEDLLFVEYNCPLEVESVKVWSKSDYIVYVLSGVKTWETLDQNYTVHAGEALYLRKGANVLRQSFNEDFCMLAFFLSDEIIRDTVHELKGKVHLPESGQGHFRSMERLTSIPNMTSFYESMLSYFRTSTAPVSSLLELKARELLMYIITSEQNPELTAYFAELSQQDAPSLPYIMEANFTYNLQISQFAALCNRSLSSFKRDFKSHYGQTPGKWLLQRRLEFAANQLLSTRLSVSEIAYDSGFEDLSHFGKTFKDKYQKSPNAFRKRD